jgi:hypothetical protein
MQGVSSPTLNSEVLFGLFRQVKDCFARIKSLTDDRHQKTRLYTGKHAPYATFDGVNDWPDRRIFHGKISLKPRLCPSLGTGRTEIILKVNSCTGFYPK